MFVCICFKDILLLLLVTVAYIFYPAPETFAAPNLSTVVTFDSNSVPSLLVEIKVQ